MTSTERGAHEDDLAQRVVELEAVVASLTERLAPSTGGPTLGEPGTSTTPIGRSPLVDRATSTAKAPQPAADTDTEVTARAVDRRRLLTRAGTAAVGAVLGGAAVSVATASPAAAATGSFDSAVQTEPALTATHTNGGTAVKASSARGDFSGGPAIEVDAGEDGTAVHITTNGRGIVIESNDIAPAIDIDHAGPGLASIAVQSPEFSTGIWGRAKDFGVMGEATGELGMGVSGGSKGGISGVAGVGQDGAAGGVFASFDSVGVRALGSQAQLSFRGDGAPPMPVPTARTDVHEAGEVYLDDDGSLWLCVADGEPGTWVRITGPGAAGALHVLPAPVRVYDSRPGLAPATGPKTKLTARTPRPVDLTANASGVPVDATAATVTLTATATTDGSPSAPGFLAAYADGLPYPGTSNLNWTAPGTTIATTTTTALTDGRLALYASDRTDVIVDVIAYHR